MVSACKVLANFSFLFLKCFQIVYIKYFQHTEKNKRKDAYVLSNI